MSVRVGLICACACHSERRVSGTAKQCGTTVALLHFPTRELDCSVYCSAEELYFDQTWISGRIACLLSALLKVDLT